MTRHCLIWKPVKIKTIRGTDATDPYLPDLIARGYRGTLLVRILSMPRGNPISFDAAMNLVGDKSTEALSNGRIGYQSGECFWYQRNFVEWISSLGYHIEITGDEFETYAMTDKLA